MNTDAIDVRDDGDAEEDPLGPLATAVELAGDRLVVEVERCGDRWHGSARIGRDMVTFVGEDPADLEAEFAASIEDYREFKGKVAGPGAREVDKS